MATTADLDTRIYQIEQELTVLKQARDLLQGTVVITDRPTGPYSAMSLIDAMRDVVQKYGPLSAPEIAKRIAEGGVQSRSKNLAATVHQAALQATDFTKVDGVWHVHTKGARK